VSLMRERGQQRVEQVLNHPDVRQFVRTLAPQAASPRPVSNSPPTRPTTYSKNISRASTAGRTAFSTACPRPAVADNDHAIRPHQAFATGDCRNGHAGASDGHLDVDLSAPERIGAPLAGTVRWRHLPQTNWFVSLIG
jgi:hypothetical protein